MGQTGKGEGNWVLKKWKGKYGGDEMGQIEKGGVTGP